MKQIKYKTLDHKLRPKSERKVDHIAGYEMALVKFSQKHDINPNLIAILLCVYDFDFFSGNTLQKRYPAGGKYIIRRLYQLLEKRLILKAFDETEVKVARRKGEGDNIHVHIEPRMIRERFRLSAKARRMVEDFLDMVNRYGNTVPSPEEKLHSTPYQRNHKGTLSNLYKKTPFHEDGVVNPFAEDGTIYYEEEDNVDAWYKQGGL